ncbi:MAG: 4-hydroxy-tetrahydrodipicolinate synthase [Cellvibrionaceae bacterium]
MGQHNLQLEGSMVALVSPMHADGSLDWEALDKLVDFHIEGGTSAIVAVGTTGESATLSVDEHLAVVKRVVERTNERTAVIAGTGANSTSEAVSLTKAAHDLGVDACLLVVPYYNKPTQEGLYQHYMQVADSVAVPQILYNVPGRTITDMENETVLRLAGHENIIGIKDATGDMARGRLLIEQAPENFTVYSGDDLTAVELMLLGAKGNISVTANVVPQKMADLCRLAIAGETDAARSLQDALVPLHNALFTESNPIPVKWAMHAMGLTPLGIRLPLTPLTQPNCERLREAMVALSIISS